MPAAGWAVSWFSTLTLVAVAKGVFGGSFFITAVEFCMVAGWAGMPQTDEIADLFTKVVAVDGGGGAADGCTDTLC